MFEEELSKFLHRTVPKTIFPIFIQNDGQKLSFDEKLNNIFLSTVTKYCLNNLL